MSKQAPDWLVTGFDGEPKFPDWYPVLTCFDPSEGYFPGGAYWDGTKWDDRNVAMFIDERCATKERAKKIADQNDPEW